MAKSEVRGNVDDDDIGRTDDPVRMYLREMGSVELLSREGEIAIAKRIEAGRDMMIGGICESPLTLRAIMGWRDALNESKMLLRDIIDLDATYGSAFAMTGRGGDAQGQRRPPKPRREAEPAEGEETAAELADIEAEADGEDSEGEESSISLAAMEAQLTPGLIGDLRRDRRVAQKNPQAAGPADYRAGQGNGAAAGNRTPLRQAQSGNHRIAETDAVQQHPDRAPRRTAL